VKRDYSSVTKVFPKLKTNLERIVRVFQENLRKFWFFSVFFAAKFNYRKWNWYFCTSLAVQTVLEPQRVALVQGSATYATHVCHTWHAKQFLMARRSSKFYQINFVMIHTEGLLTLTCIKVGTLNDLKPFKSTVSKTLPIPALGQLWLFHREAKTASLSKTIAISLEQFGLSVLHEPSTNSARKGAGSRPGGCRPLSCATLL